MFAWNVSRYHKWRNGFANLQFEVRDNICHLCSALAFSLLFCWCEFKIYRVKWGTSSKLVFNSCLCNPFNYSTPETSCSRWCVTSWHALLVTCMVESKCELVPEPADITVTIVCPLLGLLKGKIPVLTSNILAVSWGFLRNSDRSYGVARPLPLMLVVPGLAHR